MALSRPVPWGRWLEADLDQFWSTRRETVPVIGRYICTALAIIAGPVAGHDAAFIHTGRRAHEKRP